MPGSAVPITVAAPSSGCEAQILLIHGHFGGSVYLAGRAVESMLRAVIWTHDKEVQQGRKSLETGHDLRQILTVLRSLGLLSPTDKLEGFIQTVGRLLTNNLCFASSRYVETLWWGLSEVGKRRTMKQASTDFFDGCIKGDIHIFKM